MVPCEFLAKCPFYQDKLVIDNKLGKIFKSKYCLGNKTVCARYRISTTIGKEYVTNTIFPYMNDKAEQLIAEVRSEKE